MRRHVDVLAHHGCLFQSAEQGICVLNPLIYQMYAEQPATTIFQDVTVEDSIRIESGCFRSCVGYSAAEGCDALMMTTGWPGHYEVQGGRVLLPVPPVGQSHGDKNRTH